MLRLSERPPLTRRAIFESVATFALVVAILYLGAGILVPLVLAILLAFALSPMVDLLRRRLHLPDSFAVIVSVLSALLFLGLFAYVAATQLLHIAAELPAYQTTIANKLRVLQQQLEGGFLDALRAAVGTLTEQLSTDTDAGATQARSSAPVPVTIANEVGNPLGVVSSLFGTLAGPLATAAIVVIFLVFLLLGRGELQERFIRLVSRGGYSTTNLAMSDASQRVGRYLQWQFFINIGYGVAFGLGLLVIGVPGAILWGLMIMLFRYIPFVGGLLVACIPILLAFAVDSGWGMLLATVGLFAVIDLTVANVVEPRIYGSSTGVSAVAILLSAMFWATLWGPVGLILATPMTVCLVVIGRYIPQFQVLETLLGSEPVLEPSERLYQRMLKGNVEEAIELAEEILEERDLESFQETTLLPALRLASGELSDTPEALAQRRVLATSIDAVIDELGGGEQLEGKAVVLIGGRTEIDESAARVVAQRLATQQIGSRVLPPMAVRQESISRIDLDGAEVVCLFYLAPEIRAQTRYVTRRLKIARPGLKVVVATLSGIDPGPSVDALRVDGVAQGFEGALEAIEVQLQMATAVSKLAGHQPFAGAGRGDSELGRALQAIADIMKVPLATLNLRADQRHRDDEGAYKLTEIIAERGIPLVISPGADGEEFGQNPYLQGNGIHFYAGVPLNLADGLTVGSLVIVDYEEHPFDGDDLVKLQQLAEDLVARFGDAPSGPPVDAAP